MGDIEKSKMDAFIPKIKECAYETEKTRRDYLRQCSEYYDKYLNGYFMKEKRFWMMNEEMKVQLEIRDQEDAEEHVKNCRKCSRQQEPEEQQKQEQQQQERKKRGRRIGNAVNRVVDQRSRRCRLLWNSFAVKQAIRF